MQEIERTAIFNPGDGKPPFRLGVLLILVNRAGEIFAGERTDMPQDGRPWQMPQGGIKAFYIGSHLRRQETAEEAAFRELREEVGPKVRANLISVGATPIAFDFDRSGNEKYRGQMLTPVLLRYVDGKIDISRKEDGDTKPAFANYGWFPTTEIVANATAVKAPVYEKALSLLAPAMMNLEPHMPESKVVVGDFRSRRNTPQ
jgi:8-oxo-dGTP pyrophosphatase MutT (NUDIX family)